MTTRLPAEERKAAVLDCACGIFSTHSYSGTTTAEIAREAGVTEPVLYRHFASKQALYLAVLEESWQRLRALWEAAVADEPDPKFWVSAMGHAYFASNDPKVMCADLWIQALTEASDEGEIRKFLRKQMREVHDYVSDVMRRSQEAGGVYPDRDANAEAWIFISIGLLGTVGRRVGSLLEEDFEAIVASRRKWMTGA
ncbi:MAG: TetR/AcrR family transcriptional regulator [Actinomycetota bacterium]